MNRGKDIKNTQFKVKCTTRCESCDQFNSRQSKQRLSHFIRLNSLRIIAIETIQHAFVQKKNHNSITYFKSRIKLFTGNSFTIRICLRRGRLTICTRNPLKPHQHSIIQIQRHATISTPRTYNNSDAAEIFTW